VPKKEVLTFYAKSFFGDSLDATLSFYQGDVLVHQDTFRYGYLNVTVPDQLQPGSYDVVARRTSGNEVMASLAGEVGEYRVDSLFIPLATHIFRHAPLHGDLKLTGGNFSGPPIENFKFDPLLYSYLSRIDGELTEELLDVSRYAAGDVGNSLRWGGALVMGDDEIIVEEGEASHDGVLYHFEDTHLAVPLDSLGTYFVGIKDGVPDLTAVEGELDVPLANLRVEGPDYYRLNVHTPYHTIYRNGYSFYFVSYEKDAQETLYPVESGEVLAGATSDGKIYGRSRTSVPVSSVKLRFEGIGPVLSTDRLYMYATEDHFLLFEGASLLAALPRFVPSWINLSWTLEGGLSFSSYGDDGSNHFSLFRPFIPSHVLFREGPTPEEESVNLLKKLTGLEELAGEDLGAWTIRGASANASITWNGDNLTEFLAPDDALFPAEGLFPS
jgi:hypothetical protein